MDQIPAATLFDQLARGCPAVLDVRSEGEFAKGHFPETVNVPLLDNNHRHQVGLTYKRRGQAAAIELGHELVDPIRAELVQRWLSVAEKNSSLFVYCWRGGLRSRISCEWINAAGGKSVQVNGGFKSLRRLALERLKKTFQPVVLSGYTGVGKTTLLIKAPQAVDLESLAHHRGSAFGGYADQNQGSQITFENALALKLHSLADRPILVEDESRRIGQIEIPEDVYKTLIAAPVVLLQASLEERSHNIYHEYVEQPLRQGEKPDILEARLQQSLARLKRKLGGKLYQDVSDHMQAAFAALDGQQASAHSVWIKALLTEYYDKAYQHYVDQWRRPVLFAGSWSECLQWWQEYREKK